MDRKQEIKAGKLQQPQDGAMRKTNNMFTSLKPPHEFPQGSKASHTNPAIKLQRWLIYHYKVITPLVLLRFLFSQFENVKIEIFLKSHQ